MKAIVKVANTELVEKSLRHIQGSGFATIITGAVGIGKTYSTQGALRRFKESSFLYVQVSQHDKGYEVLHEILRDLKGAGAQAKFGTNITSLLRQISSSLRTKHITLLVVDFLGEAHHDVICLLMDLIMYCRTTNAEIGMAFITPQEAALFSNLQKFKHSGLAKTLTLAPLAQEAETMEFCIGLNENFSLFFKSRNDLDPQAKELANRLHKQTNGVVGEIARFSLLMTGVSSTPYTLDQIKDGLNALHLEFRS